MGILKNIIKQCSIFLALLGINATVLNGQEKIVDQIIAVVGNDIILQSDLESQVLQYQQQGIIFDGNIKCNVLEELLMQKLLIHQAGVDSVVVGDDQIESELDRRLKYFISQIGSKQKLEEYYNKSIIQIKEDLREVISEQLLAQTMQNEIIGDIKITPAEIKKFYNDIPRDSLPYVESELELRQVVIYPPYSDQAIYEVRERLLSLRKRILNGESFSTLAILYSEDPGTAKNGGKLGMVTRNDIVPEFADAAFKLKEGGVSNIVETEYGYHIIQLIERDGEQINVRHILMKPKISAESRLKAMTRLDSLATVIRLDSLSFERAAKIYSEDDQTRMGGGLMLNPMTMDTKFKVDELDKADYFAVKNLKIGEISDPFESFNQEGKKIYKIIQLTSKSEPHKANLTQDYNLIEDFAKSSKQQEIIMNWVEEKQKNAYIRVDENYVDCNFQSKGWVN